jgi:acyl-coenzyme A thioesterase PaaI-like protein
MSNDDEPLHRSRSCFVCGTENERGLHLQPRKDGRKVYVEYTPAEAYRGFSSTIHGGLTAMLLDEVVGHAAGLAVDGKAATVELTITYKAPVRVGSPVRAEGWVAQRRGKVLFGRGRLISLAPGPDGKVGKVLAEARGRFLGLDEKLLGRFTGRDAATP